MNNAFNLSMDKSFDISFRHNVPGLEITCNFNLIKAMSEIGGLLTDGKVRSNIKETPNETGAKNSSKTVFEQKDLDFENPDSQPNS